MPTLQFRHSALHPFVFTNFGEILVITAFAGLCPLSIYNIPTCTKPTQKPPPEGIGHARAKVSWFGILPHCLYLSLLEKELQVSYRQTPHFSALWKEKSHF